jgi:hypothetical protein
MNFKVFETINGYKVLVDDASVIIDDLADYIDSSKDFRTTEIRKCRGIAQSVIIVSGYKDISRLREIVDLFVKMQDENVLQSP